MTGDGKVRVKNDGNYANGTFSEICGVATIPDPNVPGLLEVDFPTSNFFNVNGIRWATPKSTPC